MAGNAQPLMLILAILCGCGFMCGTLSFTMEEVGNMIMGPLNGAIDLSSHNLSGPIPPELGKLTNLSSLDLHNNSLSGPIPPELGKLTNLFYLDLHNNSLSGPIPPELGSLTKLQVLDLSSNSLFGPIPQELANFTPIGPLFLDLSSNHLFGPIPPELGKLTNLYFLDLHNNSLSGPIPPELSKLTKLNSLRLSFNSLSGPIPHGFGDLTELGDLDLSSNDLFGPIPPELGKMTNLEFLRLHNNSLSNPIPPELSKLTKLEFLHLFSNSLFGPIPQGLGNLTKLPTLDLSSNDLFGPIPPELGKLTNLYSLDLHNNNFSGPIPPELSKLTKLDFLDLSFNSLSGPIPQEIGNLTELIILDLSSNDLFGPIPSELGKLTKLFTLKLDSTNLLCEDVGPNLRHEPEQVPVGPLGPINFHQPGLKHVDTPQTLAILTLPCSPPSWVQQLYGQSVLIQIGFRNQSTEVLDLSSLPEGSKFVNVSGPNPALGTIKFWEGCNDGCVVDLQGTGAKLSRSTKREICLGRISVFMDGEVPQQLTDAETKLFNGSLKLNGRIYNLTDPDFVNSIDLGPHGKSFTGVGLSRVRSDSGNLCGNPEARGVVVGLYSVFCILGIALCFIVWALARRWAMREPMEAKSNTHVLITIVVYLFGIIGVVLVWVDFYTDIRVLLEVWGAWPQWVLLACIIGPYIISTTFVAESWVYGLIPLPKRSQMGLRWIWPPPQMDTAKPLSPPSLNLWRCVVLIFTWPLCIPAVLLLDMIAIVDKLGFHPFVGGHIYSLDLWFDSRSLIELMVRTGPQVVFQTVVYMLGSSRATRVYVDQTIFVTSISLSLLSVLFQLARTLWQAVQASEYPWVTFWRRLHCIKRSWVVELHACQVAN